MKNKHYFIAWWGILFLFFIQMAGTLVSAIYILDLMNTSLDAKALGVLFFFSPAILLLFRKKVPKPLIWFSAGLLILARGATPYLDTSTRMLVSGIGTGSALILLCLLIRTNPKGDSSTGNGWLISAGLAVGVATSVLLRTVHYSIDYSLTVQGSWAGWLLGVLLAGMLMTFALEAPTSEGRKEGKPGWAVVGICLVLTLVYFTFSAPAVLARWTEGNYALIVGAVSLLAASWALMASLRMTFLQRLHGGGLAAWNLAFTASLMGTILAQRVPFPTTLDGVVVIGGPTWLQLVPVGLMLILSPVIYLDMTIFVDRVRETRTSPAGMVPGVLAGGGLLVLLVFINIFTNVWGYVSPISNIFRNLFWLPFLLITGGITLIALGRKPLPSLRAETADKFPVVWTVLLVVLLAGTVFASLRGSAPQTVEAGKAPLTVMTYNLQAGNDDSAEPSFDRQLAIIRQVAPDILALQESDTSRISLNNNDLVRYFASQLGYYSYYGPTTVSGTFGTAILSKYPLYNTRTVFTFSDQDEIGTAEAEIEVDGVRFHIYNVHPDGSDEAMLAFARTLVARTSGKEAVIALGDYNLRDYEKAYQMIAAVLQNAWVSVYPSEIGADGTDMSGDNRIDHIFLSPQLGIRNPVYVLPPDSATDHPVHWADITWGD